jgi:hypothetical protein
MNDVGTLYLESARATFRKYRALAEGAMEQVDDAAFFAAPPGEEPNSIAIIVKHVAGNLRSRWTDFLTTDGEKPDRDRDGEFEQRDGDTRASLMARWNGAWEIALRELDALTPEDLTRTVTIRAEPHTVVLAVDRQLTHAAYHVGQIVLLAKQHAREWKSLSIPRGQSRQFTAALQAQANDSASR